MYISLFFSGVVAVLNTPEASTADRIRPMLYFPDYSDQRCDDLKSSYEELLAEYATHCTTPGGDICGLQDEYYECLDRNKGDYKSCQKESDNLLGGMNYCNFFYNRLHDDFRRLNGRCFFTPSDLGTPPRHPMDLAACY